MIRHVMVTNTNVFVFLKRTLRRDSRITSRSEILAISLKSISERSGIEVPGKSCGISLVERSWAFETRVRVAMEIAGCKSKLMKNIIVVIYRI